ncbi:MAG TPA: hypothetical protein VKA60_25345 [Blastocatellia bacterium]|nr:hypothetical protein [Blastocatellia bacterium]
MIDEFSTIEQEGAIETPYLRRIFNAINLTDLLMDEGHNLTDAIYAAASVFGMNSLMLAVVIQDLDRAEELSLFNVLHREVSLALGE